MSESNFLYFAYGSNMFTAWLHKRCPSARALGVAALPGYKLNWHKRSVDKSGKCDIVTGDPANSIVFGVLYEIAEGEKQALDAAEAGYNPVEVIIQFVSKQITATTYCAIIGNIDPSLRPYTWYRALVVAGAKQHELPEKHIQELADAAANEDFSTRHRDAMALIDRENQ